jgi:hypothetical protein
LILYNNSFTGTIPNNLNLRDLFYLDLGYNDLSGTIPADWVETMYDLRTLYLNNNRLTGSLPEDFAEIGNNRLTLVVVNDNQLTGQIPGGFAIRVLDLTEFYNNDFSSMDMKLCENIVFEGGEMVAMRVDCDVCACKYFCGVDQCF